MTIRNHFTTLVSRLAIAVVALVMFAAPQSAKAIGFEPTDFLVTDYACQRTAVYDQDFAFKGFLDGGFYGNGGIDFNPAGNVILGQYVYYSTPTFREITPSGATAQSFNDTNAGNTYDIALHPVSGNIFRSMGGPVLGVREYTPSGTVVRTLNAGVDYYYGVAVLPGNILWAGRFQGGMGGIDVFDLTTGAITSTIDVSASGQGIAYSMFYSATTNTVLMTDGLDGDVFEWAADGSFLRRFNSDIPYTDRVGVTRGPNGDVYAAFENYGVVRWSADGTFQGFLSTPESCGYFSGILWAGNIGARITDVTVAEGDTGTTGATFTVTMVATTQTATIDWTTTDGTAIAPDDYVQASGTLVFAAGETEKTITVQVNGDILDEGDETFKVVLGSPVNTTITTGGGTATILDNEPAISIADVTQNEALATMTFTVSLSAASTEVVTVEYASADDTATSGREYGAVSGTLTFAAGETEQTIVVDIYDENRYEPDESFFINLSNPTTSSIADNQATGTITNDDPVPTITIADLSMIEYDDGLNYSYFYVTLSNPSEEMITADFATANGTATAGDANQVGTDYLATSGTLTFYPEAAQDSIGVPIKSDVRDENDETFFLNMSNVVNAQSGNPGTGTILDDDSPPAISIGDASVSEGNSGTRNATFNVSLAAVSELPIAIDWATTDGTAIAPGDYPQASGTLSFAAGETGKTLTVLVNGDALDEGDETFNVVLGNPVNTTIADGEGIATILDDEPVISIADVTQNEALATMTFTVALSAASTEVITVQYASADDTATSGREYGAVSGTLTFAIGETQKTIVVDIVDENRYEPNESFFINLSNPTTTAIADDQATGTITNDDPVPTITVDDPLMMEFNSGINPYWFNVTLSNPSEQTITVDFATANGTATAGDAFQVGTDYLANSGTLTFDPEVGALVVEVQVQSDVRNEGNETLFVNLSNVSNGQLGNPGLGTIVDDDPQPAISIGDVSVTEGNTGTRNATFNVSLSAVSGLPITFTYATSNGSATGVLGPQREGPDETGNRDYQTASGSITIPPGSSSAAINVIILGDVVKEANETFLMNLSQATNSSFADDDATGTIVDDDSTPTLSIADVSIAEGNSGASNATFTVTLSGNSDLGISVDYATVDGSAAAGSDYTTASGNLSFGPDILTRTFTVEILGDMAVEANEGFVVNLSNATNATIGDGQAAGTITNDDTDVPSILSLNPRTGPAAGGQNLTIAGTNFRSGASVLFGSSEATGESVSTSSEMAATTPALTAGTLLSVTVTNTDATTVTRPASYFADFTDVPASNAFHDFIVKLAVNNVTLGCTGGAYCPTQNVNRTAMATFIARSAVGGDANVPTTGIVGITPYVCGTGGTSVFTDVAPANAFCKYIHYVASRGSMPGCTGTQFCTSTLVVRDQMAGFIARALVPGGEVNVPIAYTDSNTGRSYDLNAGIVNFTDMADNAYTRHAHYIWARGVIDGCTGTTYCPTGTVNRAAMAKFLTNAFGLTWP